MKFQPPKNIFVWIPVAVVVIAIPTSIFLLTKESRQNNPQNENGESVVESKEEDPDGTIVVEAGEGVIEKAQYDSFSYVGESARGLEAYLASKGTSVVYQVESSKPGEYTLWVKLSDDALHDSGSRSTTIAVNNTRTLGYVHFSEDTKGWKWYQVGNATLIEGMNTVVFTKNETTTAAYVMDEFKFVPI